VADLLHIRDELLARGAHLLTLGFAAFAGSFLLAGWKR
jgi:hypothetical protein